MELFFSLNKKYIFLILINLKLIQGLKNSVCCVRFCAKIFLTYIRQILKTSTILYVQFHIGICSVCDGNFPSFKIYVMFVTRILFHLKLYVWDKHSLSFKTLVKVAMHILFQLRYCLLCANSFIQDVCNVCGTHSYYIALCTSR